MGSIRGDRGVHEDIRVGEIEDVEIIFPIESHLRLIEIEVFAKAKGGDGPLAHGIHDLCVDGGPLAIVEGDDVIGALRGARVGHSNLLGVDGAASAHGEVAAIRGVAGVLGAGVGDMGGHGKVPGPGKAEDTTEIHATGEAATGRNDCLLEDTVVKLRQATPLTITCAEIEPAASDPSASLADVREFAATPVSNGDDGGDGLVGEVLLPVHSEFDTDLSQSHHRAERGENEDK